MTPTLEEFMPTKPKRSRAAPRHSPSSSLGGAHDQVVAEFHRLVTTSLGPLLDKYALGKLRHDPVVVSHLGDGVVAHAAVRSKKALTFDRIKKDKPTIGVVVNSIPLIDPSTLTELRPGAYVVRLRRVGRSAVAFDFFADKSGPAHSVGANPKGPMPMNANESIGGSIAGIDCDIQLPWDPDDLLPPTNGTDGKFCLSLWSWSHCWSWNWPKLPKWPWP
jgi:hypothetical protein